MRSRNVLRQAIINAESLVSALREIQADLDRPASEKMTQVANPTPPLDAERIGRRLQDKRIELGLTLRQLGPLIGVSPSALGRIEQGSEPLAITRRRIETWLSKPPGEFRQPATFLGEKAACRVDERLTAIERELGMRGEVAG